jgi:hypothetical protein
MVRNAGLLSALHYNIAIAVHVNPALNVVIKSAVKMNIAMTIIVHNPTFYSYYSKKHHQEGKNHRVALSHVVRKLVRIIYHLEVTNQDFNSNLLK